MKRASLSWYFFTHSLISGSSLVGMWAFFAHIFSFPTESNTVSFLDVVFEIRCWARNTIHIQGNSHNSTKGSWAQSGQNCIPSEHSRPTVCHGNGMMPIEPCVTTATLWDERCVLGGRWETLTITPRGLETWAFILEVCGHWYKCSSTKLMVYFDEKYDLHL